MSSNIESVVTESRIFPPSEAVMKSATISGRAAYDALCAEADQDYSGYWDPGFLHGLQEKPGKLCCLNFFEAGGCRLQTKTNL